MLAMLAIRVVLSGAELLVWAAVMVAVGVVAGVVLARRR